MWKKRIAVALALTAFLVFTFLLPSLSTAAQKPTKKAAVKSVDAPKTAAIKDSNVQASLKRADELMKKGEIETPLRVSLSVYEYAKDVLTTVKFFQGHYEKVVNDPATPQGEKEEIYIKLKRMGQLVPKYNSIKEMSAYNVGYLYAKKGDSERARKYLVEVLEMTTFSTKKDSISMKAKTILLGLYGLEGEF